MESQPLELQHLDPRLFRAVQESYSGFAVLQVRGDQAQVQAVPEPGALVSALGEFGLEWAVGGDTVTATLTLGGQRRSGLGRGHTLRDAQALALADALRYFGLPLPEPQWVEYDEEEGANTLELQPDAPAPLPRATAPTAPAVGDGDDPGEDPQMVRARQIIDELMEELREGGQGAKAAALITRHGGYGASIDERRAVYRELSRLRDGE